jgi:hypothetical protein
VPSVVQAFVLYHCPVVSCAEVTNASCAEVTNASCADSELFHFMRVRNVGGGPSRARRRCAKTVNLANDPYAPLRLYDGKWDLVPAGGDKPAAPVHIENHCAKVGEFFACNQFVNGKNMARVIFLPTHPIEDGGYAYHNQALGVEGGGSGSWGRLEIVGDRWVYSSDETDNGKKIYHRTINVFSGSDKIHFDVQRSEDGVNWTTKMSGDEARAK